MKKLFFILSLLFVIACSQSNSLELTQFVDPLIGTGGHGHTFPGATMPHGMVQLSPDTRLIGWDACSGYHYSDSTILGFSHTHLSGTGIGDYGDVLLMPTVDCAAIQCIGDDTTAGYSSRFSHQCESATPGYYSVVLDDYGIKVELTATTRAGMHRYTFPASDDAAIMLDLAHTLQGHNNLLLSLNIISDTEIEGVKKTRGWAAEHAVYFHAKFSKPFDAQIFKDSQPIDSKIVSGADLKTRLRFKTSKDEQVIVKVGISSVDMDGAKNNLMAEIPGWDFDKVALSAKSAWEQQLSRIEIETGDTTSKRIFYTALYHALISPNTFIDVDNRYLGQDLKVHTAADGKYYTVFSLWDTFRALHPLMSIIDPQLNNDFAKTLLTKSDEGGLLPMWDLASNYTGTMIGHHAVSVIVEAYMKGARNFDAHKALQACIRSSTYQKSEVGYSENGLNTGSLMPIGMLYKDSVGFVPCDMDNESVAKALEYAYNDWCIAQFAKALGEQGIYHEYAKKALDYQKYFDPSVGFMCGKRLDGTWNPTFNPAASNHRNDDYCEGNAWQWSWYVMHDVDGLVALHGGKEGFVCKLDSLFSVSSKLEGDAVSSDISGLIGQYAHGNEPSHHVTHLYNYVGQSWKTQQLVDTLLYNFYFDDPNGLSGNEDCGQMSAWYVLNSMGIYSVAPASCVYTFGRPIFDSAKIKLADNKVLTIVAKNNSKTNKYIQSVTINGIPHNSAKVDHNTLMGGANIEIVMGAEPNKSFGI